MLVEFFQVVYEMSSLPKLLHKKDGLKNFSKFSFKHKKEKSGRGLSKNC